MGPRRAKAASVSLAAVAILASCGSTNPPAGAASTTTSGANSITSIPPPTTGPTTTDATTPAPVPSSPPIPTMIVPEVADLLRTEDFVGDAFLVLHLDDSATRADASQAARVLELIGHRNLLCDGVAGTHVTHSSAAVALDVIIVDGGMYFAEILRFDSQADATAAFDQIAESYRSCDGGVYLDIDNRPVVLSVAELPSQPVDSVDEVAGFRSTRRRSPNTAVRSDRLRTATGLRVRSVLEHA